MSIVNKAILQSFSEGLFAKIKARFVDKSGENIISGKTTIMNGYIPGGMITHFNNTNRMYIGEGTGHYCGTRNKSIPANRHISHIVFAVRDDYEVGKVIDGVNIGIVKTSNNEVFEMLKINAKYPVQKNESSNITGDKVIVVEIDKTYTEEVYVIFGARGLLWNDTVGHGYLQCVGGNSLPQVGTVLTPTTGQYSGRFEIYGSGIALRDLANSGTSGVSRDEFNQHVTDNEQQHQTFTSNISANTQNITAANNNISANTQSIASLDGSAAKKGSPNTFTSQNTFKNNSPVVDKYFPIKNIDADGIDELYDGATYCCNPKQGIQNSFVSGLIVPIHNSQPGDIIRASYFTVNAATLRTTSGVLGEKDYTVQDVLYKGHYCIIIEVNNTFNYAVGFGFGITSKFVGSRRIGLLKTDLPHSSNIAWSSYNRPADADNVSYLSGKFMIPYMITRKSTSELVTRFDLANNTVPLNIYQVGELKAFAFDLGESTEIDGKTWLRCEGQVVQSVDHPELATLIGEQNGLVTLPSNSGTDYMYICVGV